MIECRECGLQLTDGARFCRACGTPVTGEQPATGGPKPDPDGGYWAAVGRAGADREVRGSPASSAATTAVVPPPPAGRPPTYASPAPDRPRRNPGLIAAALLGALAVLAAATFAGYLLSREDPDQGKGTERTTTSAPRPDDVGSRQEPNVLSASCTASKSRDAGGNLTTYEPALVMDRNEATAWRCDGTGIGERIEMRFDRPVHLSSVGLIPGIVKVDSADGTDRFVQNDKIALVRWHFDEGQEEQAFAPTRELQRMEVDVTTSSVTIEILRVVPGTETPNGDGEVQAPTGKSPVAEVELRGDAAG